MSIFDGLANVFTDTFGETVAITLGAGPAKDITAIFREESDMFLEQGSIGGVRSSRLVLRAQSSDVVGVVSGDTVVRQGVTYTVIDVEPDPHGMTALPLQVA